MAVRVAVQKQYRYDPALGRHGELLLAGEETALMQEFIRDGYVGMWVPQSRVQHIITPDRLELDHIRRFFFSLAESKRPCGGLAAWPLVRALRGGWYTCRALKYLALSKLHPQAAEPDRWMQYLTRISYCWGRVEAEWGGLPEWSKPAPVRRLKRHRAQPRITMPGPHRRAAA